MQTAKQVGIRFQIPLKCKNGRSRSLITREITSYFNGMPDVMTVMEAARAIRCSKNTLYELIKEGRVAAIKIGRCFKVPKVALVDFMVNEKNYFILSPQISDCLWTSGKKCGMSLAADEHTDKVCKNKNQNNKTKGA